MDPYTKRLVSIYGKIGKKVIKRYTKQLGGGLLSKKYMKISRRQDGEYQIKSLQRYTRLLGKWGYKSWFPITNVKRAGLFVYDFNSDDFNPDDNTYKPGKCWQENDLTGRINTRTWQKMPTPCEDISFTYMGENYNIQ